MSDWLVCRGLGFRHPTLRPPAGDAGSAAEYIRVQVNHVHRLFSGRPVLPAT